MKSFTSLAASLLLIITLAGCGKSGSSDGNAGNGRTSLSPVRLHVLSTSLSLRSKPSLRATKLGLLRYGQMVRPFASQSSEKQLTVSGIKGGWLKVQAAGKTGYVFSGFLSRYNAPSLRNKNLKAYALRYFKKVGGVQSRKESKNIVIKSQRFSRGLTLETQVMTIGSSVYKEERLLFTGLRLSTGFLLARALISTSGLGDSMMNYKFSSSLKKGRVEIWRDSEGIVAKKTGRGVLISFMQQAD